jgi:hypothetical protein
MPKAGQIVQCKCLVFKGLEVLDHPPFFGQLAVAPVQNVLKWRSRVLDVWVEFVRMAI